MQIVIQCTITPDLHGGLILCKEYATQVARFIRHKHISNVLYKWGYPAKVLEEPPIKKKSKVWIQATTGIPSHFDYFPLCVGRRQLCVDENGYNAVLSYQKYYQTKQDNFKWYGPTVTYQNGLLYIKYTYKLLI